MTGKRVDQEAHDALLRQSLAQPGIAEAMRFWRNTRTSVAANPSRGAERAAGYATEAREADAQLG